MADNHSHTHGHGDDVSHLYADHDHHLHPTPASIWRRLIFTVDHKVIAKQFLIMGIVWGFIGALMSLMIRWTQMAPGQPFPVLGNLFWPDNGGVIPAEVYSMLFSMHGTIMIFFAITPILIGCFGNLCIPLMIGARDMIFPWLNMASFWVMVVSSIFMFYSLFVPLGAAAGGWTSYPTLALKPWQPGSGQSLWVIALYFAGTSSIMGAINYITTIFRLRAPGMKLMDMPLTIWGMLLTAILNALFIPVLTGGLLLLLLDRVFGTHFYVSGAFAQSGVSGDPILYQHLFWIFGHPEVYILILPAWGIVADLLSFFARKPAFGYKRTVYSMTAITLLSMVVYGHHMFTTGMAPLLTSAFQFLTLVISIPSAVFFLNWLGTLWGGNIRLTVPMLFTLGTVFTFGLGGLTGLHLGSIGTDVLLHNTYFVVGHFHLTMAASSLLASIAGTYYWWPKMWGRMMDDRLGKIHFWASIIPIVFIFCTMLIEGYAGMHRRIYNPYEYEYLKRFQSLNTYIAVAAVTVFSAQILFVYNMIRSLRVGPKASANPWEVGTLEWTTSSPPPHHNFDQIPVVVTGPHEFNNPKVIGRDWIAQTEKIPG